MRKPSQNRVMPHRSSTALLFSALAFAFALPQARADADPAVDVFRHGLRNHPKVALTFDACSTRRNQLDQKIVEVLVNMGAPATFFLGGEWMKANSDFVQALLRLPQFELASHGYSHPHMDRMPKTDLKTEFIKAQTTFQEMLGRKATFFRPPFGDYDAKVVREARRQGMETVTWDLPSGDPDKGFTAKMLVDRVVNHSKNGSIVVLHMNGHGWKTAQALPKIIAGLKAKGFELVTVGRLYQEAKSSRTKLAKAKRKGVRAL